MFEFIKKVLKIGKEYNINYWLSKLNFTYSMFNKEIIHRQDILDEAGSTLDLAYNKLNTIHTILCDRESAFRSINEYKLADTFVLHHKKIAEIMDLINDDLGRIDDIRTELSTIEDSICLDIDYVFENFYAIDDIKHTIDIVQKKTEYISELYKNTEEE